uniref:Putative radical SAM superfamily protein n=1 Tax=viral metagenome TaxID=1070528 RepID=A0A6H2A1C0_9ZZZZ
MKCGWCHNSDLVISTKFPKALSVDEIEKILIDRVLNFSKYFCISGGEPTIQSDILPFCTFLNKVLGGRIKLDTNGRSPRILKDLIPYLDYIAMDIKESPLKEKRSPILDSIKIIQDSNIKHLFRTTVVPGLVKEKDIIEISSLMEKDDIYYLQQYTPSENIIDPSYRNLIPESKVILGKYREVLLKRCKDVFIRS